MNYYGFPPGYTPDPQSVPSTVPAGVKLLAKRAGATYIAGDGALIIYHRRLGEWYYSVWQGTEFGSWWKCKGGLPTGAVEL